MSYGEVGEGHVIGWVVGISVPDRRHEICGRDGDFAEGEPSAFGGVEESLQNFVLHVYRHLVEKDGTRP